MRITCLTILFAIISFTFINGEEQPPFTPADKRLKGMEVRKQLQENSLVNNIPFRSVGPTVMSGRVADLDISPTDPSHFYVGYASTVSKRKAPYNRFKKYLKKLMS